jgi:hypothetical protein
MELFLFPFMGKIGASLLMHALRLIVRKRGNQKSMGFAWKAPPDSRSVMQLGQPRLTCHWQWVDGAERLQCSWQLNSDSGSLNLAPPSHRTEHGPVGEITARQRGFNGRGAA